MAVYSFVTIWEFEAPVEGVWKIIRDMDRWPEWWKYVREVTLISPGDANDIGSIRRITWTTALPYTIVFDSELVSLEPLKKIEGRARGDLSGTGIWTFTETGSKTTVRYDWSVSTSKKWMNLLEPIARPLFKWNHDQVMKGGYKGIMRKLNEK